ncbi:MAG: hypothetical protein RL120_10705 [Gammaproteobacteria bacterium]
MNWDALGAIGEIAGAIGVIVTLLYLARQIRESNHSARHAGTQEILNQVTSGIRDQAKDPALVDLWIRGHMCDPDLTPEETTRFRMQLMQFVMIWERAFSLHREGRLDESVWQTLSRHRGQIVMSRGFKTYFDARKRFYSDEFRHLLEQEIANSAGEEWLPQGVEEAIADFKTN